MKVVAEGWIVHRRIGSVGGAAGYRSEEWH